MKTRLIALAAASIATAAHAAGDKPAAKPFVVVNADVGVPVFANDIVDHPYEVVGEVKAKVRKATIFSKEASQAKIYRELWERAQKLGADAVVKASYGDSHVTAFSWGSTTATGTAVRFKPGAVVPATTPAPAPAP